MNAAVLPLAGHNLDGLEIQVEVRMFNSISRYADSHGAVRRLRLAAGSDINDILQHMQVPRKEVFLVLVNGRDISPTLGTIRTSYEVTDGDVVAFSGPVPYSWGYGSPVV